MISAGRLDRLVQFRKRGPMPAQPGLFARPFANAGSATWAQFTPGTPFRLYLGDVKLQLPAGALTVRDYDFTRTVTPAFRFVLDGQEYQVRSANPPARGAITMDVMEASWRARYAEDMEQNGTVFEIRRAVANGQPIRFNARGRAFGYQPQELVNGIDQGTRRILILAEDVEAGGIEGGLQENDAIFMRGSKLNVMASDDSTHRIADDLCAYLITAEG